MQETNQADPAPNLTPVQEQAQTRHIHRFVVALILGIAATVLAPNYVRASIWANIVRHKVLAAFFFLFIILALTVIWSFGAKLDDLAFLFLNKHAPRSKFTDSLMIVFTQIGNGLTAFLLTGLFYLLNQRIFAFEFLLGTVTLWLVVELTKLLVGRKRPYFVIDTIRIVGNRAIGYSFPSGHTSQAFFMATIFSQSFHLPWYLVLIMYFFAGITGITRIYLGAHYPRDVIAGAFLGTIWGFFSSVLYGIVSTWFG